MEENENKNFDIEQFKCSDGSYHLENEQLSENEMKELFKVLTSDDTVIIQEFNTTPETTVDN